MIIAEAVFDTDDDPSINIASDLSSRSEEFDCPIRTAVKRRENYHKFVKTTPKPNATKNSRGELAGGLPEGLPPAVFAGGAGLVDEDIMAIVDVGVTVISRILEFL